MAANDRTRNTLYGVNGSAAYDLRSYGGSAAPEIQRPTLPQEQRRPVKHVRVKAKLAVSPFALFGMLGAACMLVLVIFGYVQLYEATTEASKLQRQMNTLTQENQMLHSEYEGKIDLAAIEAKAMGELGMTQPTSGQTVYLNLSGSDKAVVLQQSRRSTIAEVIDAVKTSVTSLVVYLS